MLLKKNTKKEMMNHREIRMARMKKTTIYRQHPCMNPRE